MIRTILGTIAFAGAFWFSLRIDAMIGEPLLVSGAVVCGAVLGACIFAR